MRFWPERQVTDTLLTVVVLRSNGGNGRHPATGPTDSLSAPGAIRRPISIRPEHNSPKYAGPVKKDGSLPAASPCVPGVS